MVEKIQQDMECKEEGEREKAITKKERKSKFEKESECHRRRK